MRRSTAIILGTWLGGVAIYAAMIYVFQLPPREPAKTVGFVSSFVLAAIVFTLLTRGMKKPPSETLTLEEMEKQGLLLKEQHEAMRAFQVEEFEDEGCQYFIELKNGSVLFLCGQYLYDYEPVAGRTPHMRKFPCTEFTLLRHRRTGSILDVVCGGAVLEPECEVSHFTAKDHDSLGAPADGDVITDRTYDQIKQSLMKRKRK